MTCPLLAGRNHERDAKEYLLGPRIISELSNPRMIRIPINEDAWFYSSQPQIWLAHGWRAETPLVSKAFNQVRSQMTAYVTSADIPTTEDHSSRQNCLRDDDQDAYLKP